MPSFWGKSSSGVEVSSCSRPSILRQGQALARARVDKTELGLSVLIPETWSLRTSGTQVLLELPKADTPRFRRVYGFVAGGHVSSSGGTVSPAQLSVVLKLPFYFSGPVSSAEKNGEWGVVLPRSSYLFLSLNVLLYSHSVLFSGFFFPL